MSFTDRPNKEDALVERYVELIVTSHDEDCLWRKRGCDGKLCVALHIRVVLIIQTRYSNYL